MEIKNGIIIDGIAYECVRGLGDDVSLCRIGKLKDILILEHEAIDLGLSVKWANCNIGAETPSDYGDYFAWGEISNKSTYTEQNSKTYKKDLENIAGNPTYDVARASWGGTWRLPTKNEMDELEKCRREWTTMNGHNGYKITGPNGNSIFLPATGGYGVSPYLVEEIGFYWGATPDARDTNYACGFFFDSIRFYRNWYERYVGQSVRPVTE